MMENSSERERTLLFSTSFGLSALSGFVGSLVGGQLPRWMSSVFVLTLDTAPAYGAALLISPALNLLAMFPLLWMREASRPTWNLRLVVPNARLVTLAAEDIWRQFKAAPVLTWRGLRHRQVIVKLLAPNAIISVGAALLIPYMNVFFRERHHVPDGTLGVIFALSSMVTGVATLAAPLLAQRWGKIRSVALAQAASLPFLLIIGFAPSLPLAVLAFWFRGALMNLGGPIYSAFTMEHVTKDERATVNAFSSVTWNIGWAVCPYLSGLVQQRWGFGPLFVMTSVLYGLAAALTYVFFAGGELRETGKLL
jgi:predicted MFS family arabinose efflux permease